MWFYKDVWLLDFSWSGILMLLEVLFWLSSTNMEFSWQLTLEVWNFFFYIFCCCCYGINKYLNDVTLWIWIQWLCVHQLVTLFNRFLWIYSTIQGYSENKNHWQALSSWGGWRNKWFSRNTEISWWTHVRHFLLSM